MADWTTFGKRSGGSSGGRFLRPNKLKDGESVRFRILGSFVEGWERWTKDNKPVLAHDGEPWPKDKEWRPGKDGAAKMFSAMPVWNVTEEAVQVFAFTQASIADALRGYVEHEEYGVPTGYDLTLSRKGTGMDTEYTLVASPPKAVSAKVAKAWSEVVDAGFDLEELFSGGDPFAPKGVVPFPPASEDEAEQDEIPF